MESLLPRIIIFFIISFNAYAFQNTVFKLDAPKDRIEEAKMFGSDVMFLKNKEQGEGGIFVKYIVNDKVIGDEKDFLLEKVNTAKSLHPTGISKVQSKHDFVFVTFKDKAEQVITLLRKKNETSYVFIMLKDSGANFEKEKNNLLEALKSFKFL